MVLTIPGLSLATHQLDAGFVDQRCGLECVGGPLAAEHGGGELSKVFVDQRQEFRRGGGHPILQVFDQFQDVLVA